MNNIVLNRSVLEDLAFGLSQEDVFKPVLEGYFGISLEKTPQQDTFDFVNEDCKVIIEMKSRTNKKRQYPTTMIGDNKWKKAKVKYQIGYKVYFIFNFTDKLCVYEFRNQDIEKKSGGRNDRGRPEFKYYRYIPIDDLIDVEFEIN